MKVRRKGKGWQARWYESRSGKVKGKSFPTKAEAERYAAKMTTAQAEGTYVDPAAGRVTLETWWGRYLEAAHDIAPSTRAAYAGAMKRHVLPHLGHRPLSSNRRTDVQAWIGKLNDQGVGPGSIRLAYRVLRAVLGAAVDAESIGRNPATRVKGLPQTGHSEVRILTSD